MIAEAELPKRLWVDAINTACYMQNRSIVNKQCNKTLYELWKGKKPNFSYFYIFRCKCYVHNNVKDQPKTFNAKANEAIFFGYSTESKAIKVFNKRIMVVEELPYVIFDESCHILKRIDADASNDEFEKLNIRCNKQPYMEVTQNKTKDETLIC